MKSRKKLFKILALTFAFIVVMADVGIHSSYLTFSVSAEEDIAGNDANENAPDVDDSDNAGDDSIIVGPGTENIDIVGPGTENDPEPAPEPEPEPTPEPGPVQPVTLQVLPSTSQVSFGTIQQGDIVTPVSFAVRNISEIPVDAFSFNYGTNPDAFIVDLPESISMSPSQELKYSVKVNPDLKPGSYESSLVFSPKPAGGAEQSTVTSETAVKFLVTVNAKSSKVDRVCVYPNVFNMQKGSSYMFSCEVLPSDAADKNVSWSVSGANSGNTVITADGKLVIDQNETSKELTVYAVSSANSNVYGYATVNIEEGYYSVNVVAKPAHGGVVTGGGNVKSGSPCELAASANNGYKFLGWYYRDKKVSKNKKYYINNVTENMTVTARFEQKMAQVILNSSNNDFGTVSDSAYVPIGESYKIKAKAKDGYRFVCWKENNKVISKDAEYTLKNINDTRRLTALFEPNKVQIHLATNPDNAGKLTGDGSYDYDKDVKITAEPAPGYKFVGWLCENNYFSTDKETVLYKLKRDYSIVAVFEPVNNVTYNITTKVVGGKGKIFPSGTSPVSAGRDLPIGVTPDSGYQVKAFVVDGINQGAIPGYMLKNRLFVKNSG